MRFNEKYPRVEFRVRDLEPAPRARTGPGRSMNATAARDPRRYYAILAAVLAALPFRHGERQALRDVLNGTVLDPLTARGLSMAVEAALPDGLAEQWGIDGPAPGERDNGYGNDTRESRNGRRGTRRAPRALRERREKS